MKASRRILLGTAIALLGAVVPRMAQAQDHIGTSVSDQATQVGMFRLANDTNGRITYHVRWGSGPWKANTLDPGKARDHWLNYDPKGIPAPEVSFNPRINEPGPSKVHKLMWGLAILGGYGPARDNHPRLYHFGN